MINKKLLIAMLIGFIGNSIATENSEASARKKKYCTKISGLHNVLVLTTIVRHNINNDREIYAGALKDGSIIRCSRLLKNKKITCSHLSSTSSLSSIYFENFKRKYEEELQSLIGATKI